MNRPTPRCTTCQVKNISLLKNCSADLLQEFSEIKTCQSFEKGQHLIQEGTESRGIFCIRSGVAKAAVHNKKGRSLILRLEGKGSIVGQRAVGKRDKQPLTITAIEKLQVCYVSSEKFRTLYAKYPGLRSEMMKSFLSEMQGVEKRALTLINNSVKERVAWVMLHIAETYHYQQGGCSIHVHLNRKDIADLAGTTKEQVSMILTELGKNRLIHFKAKHFKYFDLDGLKNIAGNI